jgi:hypothetical protein
LALVEQVVRHPPTTVMAVVGPEITLFLRRSLRLAAVVAQVVAAVRNFLAVAARAALVVALEH